MGKGVAAMSTEIELTAAIERIELSAPIEVVADVQGRVENFLRVAKQLKAACEVRIIEYVKANGPYTVGDNVTKTVKAEKKEKPKDLRATVEACMIAANGDLDLFTGLIASDGIKPGAAKRLLGEAFDEHFETTWRDVLVDGKPGLKLVTQNTQFIK